MPNVQSLIGAQGTTFNEAYVSFPLCCPSRATMLSGQYMHNHGVHGNFPPNGSWFRFRPHESNDLPVWLQDDGYYNVHIGKYMNGYSTVDGTPPRPAGLGRVVREDLRGRPLLQLPADREDGADARLRRSPSTATSRPITRPMSSPIARSTSSTTARSRDEPFWLNLWFNSPHGPFDPAPRDLFRLAGTPLPKLPAFNEKDISDKPKWLRKQVKRAARQEADQG